MPYPFTNSKRIRGWKRKVSELNKLTSFGLSLDFDRLKTYNYCSFELMIAPFSNLTRRNPPIWYSRLWVEAMSTIHLSWNDQLREWGQPYYLRTWLFDPRFFQSQVVVAIGPRIQYYENLFPSLPTGECASFPLEKHQTSTHNLYKWSSAIDEDLCDADGLEPSYISRLIKKGAVAHKADGDTIYHTRKGLVWLAEIAG